MRRHPYRGLPVAHDVFISHSSHDKPTAERLAISLSTDWGKLILDTINGARVSVFRPTTTLAAD
jgi:hypothetical protein